MDDKRNVFNTCEKFHDEEWCPIEGYESYYSVSNLGRVWSHRSNRALKPIISKTGYARVHLAVSGKTTTAPIHRLVATAFIPNPNNKPTVNHLNEIKTDNRVENLVWATYLEQNIHGTRIQRVVAHTDWKERTKKIDYKLAALKYDHHAMTWKQMRAVLQFDLLGNFVARYDSISGAANALNISAGHICCCLKGRRKSCGGYTWKYA